MSCAFSVAANWSARSRGLAAAAAATRLSPITAPAPIKLRSNLRFVMQNPHADCAGLAGDYFDWQPLSENILSGKKAKRFSPNLFTVGRSAASPAHASALIPSAGP